MTAIPDAQTQTPPEPQERLAALYSENPAFRPAYEKDTDATMAWVHGLERQYGRINAFHVLPLVEVLYEQACEAGDRHAERMSSMSPADRQAYVGRLEARRGLLASLASLSPSREDCARLAGICEAATAAGERNDRAAWHGHGPATTFSGACADLRRAIAVSAAGSPADFLQDAARLSLGTIAIRLTKATVELAAEALPVMMRVASSEAPDWSKKIQAAINLWHLPDLVRVHASTQTADQHAAEAGRWEAQGWGLLPEAGRSAFQAMDAICYCSARYAPPANARAGHVRAELAAEWQSVLDTLHRVYGPMPALPVTGAAQ